MKVKSLIFLLLFYSGMAWPSAVHQFDQSLKNSCQSCSSIHSKKMFLLLLRNQTSTISVCEDSQFSLLAKSCCKEALSCTEITQIFKESMTKDKGNVFGQ